MYLRRAAADWSELPAYMRPREGDDCPQQHTVPLGQQTVHNTGQPPACWHGSLIRSTHPTSAILVIYAGTGVVSGLKVHSRSSSSCKCSKGGNVVECGVTSGNGPATGRRADSPVQEVCVASGSRLPRAPLSRHVANRCLQSPTPTAVPHLLPRLRPLPALLQLAPLLLQRSHVG